MVGLFARARELFSTTVTEDTVAGVKVGKSVAKVVNELSDQFMQGTIPRVSKPLGEGYLSRFIAGRVRSAKLAEREYENELREKNVL